MLSTAGCRGWFLSTIGVLTLLGCADTPPAPIETREAARTVKGAEEHPPVLAEASDYRPGLLPGRPYTVEKGDTLYSIAFRLGADYRGLAGANGITEPYTIYPGQVLETVPDALVGEPSPAEPKTSPQTQATASPAVARPEAAAKPTPESTPKPAPNPKSTPKPTPKPKPKPASSSAATSKQTVETPASSATAKPTPPSTIALGPVSRWLWPGEGGVERAYSNVLHKGIDIAGKRGDPVYATAPGVVVYAGTGVKGYGVLLIVKHNEQFLSAYGHNDAMLVTEGSYVSARQQIARMGSSGTDTVKLHFEIRRQGQPVDPLRLLPRR